MRRDQIDRLRCPACRAERSFALEAREEDEREVRSGTLRCRGCGHDAPVEHGIADLLHDPPEFVVREAAGLDRFAETMRADGWDRERILKLPYEQSGYWFSQAAAFEHLAEVMELEPGATLLDVGSNTCWASNAFAVRGLRVTALDIAATPMQGLRTADWWFEENDVFFERVLSVMFDPALASESFDYVFCCEVLHHNHREHLHRTLRELYRVLRPGGRLIVLNEPLRFVTDLKLDFGQEVAEYEGHEHVYFAPEYVLAARRAGFAVRLMRPNTTPFFRREPFELRYEDSARTATKKAVKQIVRSTRGGRRAYTLYKLLWGREVSLGMICTKPGPSAPAAARADRPAVEQPVAG
ncbi:MAG TPA: class I SAM-dependent methyltransferase [Thermoleophilaceae bacterium]|jgi:SAM-dependent methyltransferase